MIRKTSRNRRPHAVAAAPDETGRRGFIGSLLAGAALGSGVLRAAAPAPVTATPVTSLEDPAAFNRLQRRICFAPGDDIVFWWMRGRRYGLIDNHLVPLFDMHVGRMHRCRDLDADRYEVSTAAAIYYTAPDEEQLLENWRNPVTGELVPFNYPAPRAGRAEYSYRDGMRVSAPMQGVRQRERHAHSPLTVVGDEASFTKESWIVATFEGSAKPVNVHDISTFGSPVAALLDPTATFVPAFEHFNDYNGWSPRLRMGERPGSSVARCSGRKVATFEQMPSVFLRLTKRVHPQAFSDPAKTLG